MNKPPDLRRNRTRVRRAFSNVAHRYDEHAQIQEQVAVRLLAKVSRGTHFKHILDVGMGTGRMARVMTKMFPRAFVVGIDSAEGMVRQASLSDKKAGKQGRAYCVVQADAAALPFKPAKFDLLVSNLTYQWVEDLPQAFAQARATLAGGGLLLATLFGRNSLHELFDSLEYGGAKGLLPQRLPTLKDIEQALQASQLQTREIHSELLTFEFHGMWDLMVWLKKIGANTLPRQGFIGKRILTKANQYYYKHFKTPMGVAATFELIWVEARR